MKLLYQYGQDVITLPAAVAGLLPAAGRIELAVLLACASKKELSEEELAKFAADLSIPASKFYAALTFWEKEGILKQEPEGQSADAPAASCNSVSSADPAPAAGSTPPAVPPTARTAAALLRNDEIPNYSGAGLASLLQRDDGALRRLIDQCQQIAGKLFTTVEVRKLVALNDLLGLDGEYIRLLYIYCREKGKPSVAYVEKTAHNLFHEDIDTLPKLTAYLEARRKADALEPTLRSMLGVGERALIPREKDALATIAALPYRGKLLELAYASMIASTQKPSFAYLASVLTDWHREGVATEADVEAVRAAHREQWEAKQKKKASPAKETRTVGKKERSTAASFEADEFFEAAMKRSYRLMQEEKKEE